MEESQLKNNNSPFISKSNPALPLEEELESCGSFRSASRQKEKNPSDDINKKTEKSSF